MRAFGRFIVALVGASAGEAAAAKDVVARPIAPQTAVARALLRLEDGWATAVVRRDAAYFRKYLAPGFVYSEDDRTMNRETVLHDLIAGSDTVDAAHNEDMHVHEFGATAVVTGWLIMQGRGAGGRFDRHYRFTDTWVRGRRGWQIVAAHDYLLPSHR